MERLRVRTEEGRLTITRNINATLLGLLVLALVVAGFLYVPFVDAFVDHHNQAFWASIALVMFVVAAPFFWNGIVRLWPWTLVLDRKRDLVMLNGRSVCELRQVRCVSLEHWSFGTGRGRGSVERLSLSLLGGEPFYLERGGFFAGSLSELREVGQSIADYTKIPLEDNGE